MHEREGGTVMNMPEVKRIQYQYEFGRNLYRCRKKRGFTQESLGKHMGVSRTYINQLERGRGNPTLQVVMKLANVLNIDAAFLLFGIRYKD